MTDVLALQSHIHEQVACSGFALQAFASGAKQQGRCFALTRYSVAAEDHRREQNCPDTCCCIPETYHLEPTSQHGMLAAEGTTGSEREQTRRLPRNVSHLLVVRPCQRRQTCRRVGTISTEDETCCSI